MIVNKRCNPLISMQRAFTLIEFLIVILIISIMAAVGVTLMRSSFKAYLTSQSLSRLNVQAEAALMHLTLDMGRLQSLGKHLPLQTTSNTLTLMTTAHQEIKYFVSKNKLMRQVNNQAAYMVAKDLVNRKKGFQVLFLGQDGLRYAKKQKAVHCVEITLAFKDRRVDNVLTVLRVYPVGSQVG